MDATDDRYSLTAIVLHWLIALLVAGTWAMGTWMEDLPFSPAKLRYYSWHKWAGVTVFALAVVRLAWRVRRAPPAPLPMRVWQARLAHRAHVALYVLLFAVPLSGWLFSSAAGFQTVWFGVLPLPDLIPKDATLKGLFDGVHEALTTVLAILVGLHVAAALKHHLIDRDRTLVRMLPGRTRRTSSGNPR